MNTNRKEIVIITGGGRCGTFFLGERLGEIIDDCFSVHEPDILYRRDPALFSKIRQFGLYQSVLGKLIRRRGLRVLSIQSIRKELPEHEILRRLRLQREKYYRSIDAHLVVEANAAWWGLTEHAHAMGFPARVACIIRDPLTWITSWQQHGGLHDRKDVVGALRLGRLEHPEWGNDPIVRLAHTWMKIYGHQHTLARQRTDHRMFRFEDVFVESHDEYWNLLRFIAGDQPRRIDWQLADALRATPSNASRNAGHGLSEQQQAVIRKICAPLATQYGYAGQ